MNEMEGSGNIDLEFAGAAESFKSIKTSGEID